MADVAERPAPLFAVSATATSASGAVVDGRPLTHGFSVVIPAKDEEAAAGDVLRHIH